VDLPLDQASIQPAPNPSKIDARIPDPHITTQKSEGDLDRESFVESPCVDTNRQDSEELIDSGEDSQCGQAHQSTREQNEESTGGNTDLSTRGQSSESTRGERAGKQSTLAIKLPPKQSGLRKHSSKPPVPEGFEARQRDNRWHLYRLHGKKLSANGIPMWNRSYIGSFTEEGLRSFYEREQDRIKNESAGQRAAIVNLLDRKRSEGTLGAGKKPSREAGG
jgi:hypothetical protein